MKRGTDWFERQYWSDVIAVRPDARIERRAAASVELRAAHLDTMDVAYGDHERQRYDIFLPDGAGPHPLFAFLHGGYWQLGHKNDYAALAAPWLERGAAFCAIGYRLAPEASLVDIIADVRAALRHIFVQASAFSIDPDRIVLGGHSAGAHLAAMATTSDRGPGQPAPAGAVFTSGVYDPTPLAGTTPGAALADSMGAGFRRLSPLGCRPPEATRCLIAWGAAETDVFASQSEALAACWQNWGARPEVCSLPNEDHYSIVERLHPGAAGPVATFTSKLLGIEMSP